MIYLGGVIFALILSAFFSAWETAVYSVNHLHLQSQRRHGDKKALRVLVILKNMPQCLTTLLVSNNVANCLGTQLFAYYLLAQTAHNHELVTTLILTPLFFFFGETLPKQLAYLHASNFLCRTERVFRATQIIIFPLTFILTKINSRLDAIFRRYDLLPVTPQGLGALRANLESLMFEGQLSPEQVAMTNRIMEIENQQVREVMMTLPQSFTIDEELSAISAGRAMIKNNAAHALLKNRYGKFTGTMLSLNDIMRQPENREKPARFYARPVPIFALATPLLPALNRLRREGAPLALVRKYDGEFIGAISLNRLVSCVVSGIDHHTWNL